MEEKLIEFFRKNPCMYNKGHKEYSHLRKRNEKLHELSKRLRVPVRKLKDRWRTLRDTYHKEKKRLSTIDDPNTVRKWKWMDHMAFLDETPQISEVLISTTKKDYYDETSPGYDNTKSSWNENYNSDDDDECGVNGDDDTIDDNVKPKMIKNRTASDSLLIPIEQNSAKKTPKTFSKHDSESDSLLMPIDQKATKKIAKTFSKHDDEYTKTILKPDDEIMMDFKTDEVQLWEAHTSSATKKSSIQLFCDSLALQIEEAHLTSYQISALQIEFLKKLQEFLPKDK